MTFTSKTTKQEIKSLIMYGVKADEAISTLYELQDINAESHRLALLSSSSISGLQDEIEAMEAIESELKTEVEATNPDENKIKELTSKLQKIQLQVAANPELAKINTPEIAKLKKDAAVKFDEFLTLACQSFESPVEIIDLKLSQFQKRQLFSFIINEPDNCFSDFLGLIRK
jgi:predicted RNase H-like nuclease (RuvC/YqgF family)